MGGCTKFDLSPYAIKRGYNAFFTAALLWVRGMLGAEVVLLCKTP